MRMTVRSPLAWLAVVVGGVMANGNALAGPPGENGEEDIPPPMGSLVETYSGMVMSNANMPGEKTAGGVRFTSLDRFVAVQFEPGPAQYQGALIDFAGHEPDFLNTTMNWRWEVLSGPVPTAGDQAVACHGDGNIASAAARGCRERARERITDPRRF